MSFCVVETQLGAHCLVSADQARSAQVIDPELGHRGVGPGVDFSPEY